MKLLYVTLLFALVGANGCMISHDLATQSLTPNTMADQLTERFAGKEVLITTIHGTTHRGVFQGTMGSDSLWIINIVSRVETIPISSVVRMKSSPGSSGPILMGIGCTIAGAMIGGAIGASAYEPDPHAGLERIIIAPMETYANTASGAVVGALIGLPVGLMVGGYISAGHEVTLHRQ